ncbi:MAG: ROK family protein [Planctomycetes bacterium]|nr:ROK family protein [Planctomycetota bacterium]
MSEKSELRNSLKSLKLKNRQAVLNYMRNVNAVSVNDISRASNLSKMTIHKIIDYYTKKGVISLVGKGTSTEEGGKKPNLFSFNPNCRFIYAVHLYDGGVKITLTNLKGDMIVNQKQLEMRDISFDDVIDMITREFETTLEERNLSIDNCIGVVIAFDGVMNVADGVCLVPHCFESWGRDIPLKAGIRQRLPGQLPIYIDNWFRYQAFGEILAAEPGNRRRFYMVGSHFDHILGGMVVDNDIYWGNTGLSGEVGHMIVDPNSQYTCRCGGKGCLEAEVAPSRVVEKTKSGRSKYPNSRVFDQGDNISFELITKAADDGDDLGQAIMEETAKHFAVALNNIVQVCDPGIIVMHGDYAGAGEFFAHALQDMFENITMRGVDRRTKIEFSDLDDVWSLMGAAHKTTNDWITNRLD